MNMGAGVGALWGLQYCSGVSSFVFWLVWGATCDARSPGSGTSLELWGHYGFGGLGFPP